MDSTPSEIKLIRLSDNAYVLVDAEDFESISKIKWVLVNDYAAYHYKRTPLPYRKTNKSIKKMHRLLMKDPDGLQIDHINGDKLDNRKQNLRVATHQQNKFNRPKRADNKSGFKGVVLLPSGKWRAQATFNKKNHNLGIYVTAKEAAEAFDKFAMEHHGEFAQINNKAWRHI